MDPYKILVSEVMLQQTQVHRVIPKYGEFLKAFPNVRALAKAPLADVLRVWNGLGYNRRAKYLRDAAIEIVKKHRGKIPAVYSELVELPGIGNYTARAVRVFAFNEPDVLVETNIRTAFVHHFFNDGPRRSIIDEEILKVVGKAAERQNSREWHWALMDYGAHLKRAGVRNNHRSAHYVRQSKFEGSLRQLRGAILHALQTNTVRSDLTAFGEQRLQRALSGLERDGLIVKEEKLARPRWRISSKSKTLL